MHRLTEDLSPADRRFYWKFVGSLFGFYGALMIIMVIDFRQADRRQRVPDVVHGYHLSSDRITRDNVAIE
jgi:hypothetical protein